MVDEKRPQPAVKSWMSNRPYLSLLAGIFGMTLIGGLDYFTGMDARVFPLYYLPIALVTWYVSINAGYFLCLFSTILWALALWLDNLSWSTGLFAFNFVTQLVSFGGITFLIGRLRVRYEREKRLNLEDELTGLANNRAFMKQALAQIATAARHKRPFCLAYLDLDNFKLLNDNLGHSSGNKALKILGELMNSQLRAGDIAARLGGDEFGILLPDTNVEGATVVLTRLKDQIEQKMERNDWPVTASIGGTIFLNAPPSLDDAIGLADSQMYQSKKNGKNNITIGVFDA